jgi:hypothetical protein
MPIDTIMTMFNIEMIEELKGGNNEGAATMSILSNGASMLIQLLPRSRTKGHSLDSATKSWTLPIKNSSSRRLACLQWNWSSISKMSRPNGMT